MNVSAKGVRDVGVLERERIVLKATRDDDIGTYILARGRTQEDGSLAMAIRPLYWFPDAPVSAGDLIVVYTKSGARKTKVNRDGSTSHFFYLGLGVAQWTGSDRAVVLGKVKEWDHLAVPADEEFSGEPD